MNELSLFSESMNGAQSTDMEQSVKALSSSNNLNNVEVSCDEVDEIDLADFKHDYRTGEPALYVGTYAKYNNGDLSGMWISIARCYGKALERPSSTRLEDRFPYHGSGAMTRSPSPLAWRPDFPGAPREAH